MTLCHLCCAIQLYLVWCGHLAHAATNAGFTSEPSLATSLTDAETDRSSTAAPGDVTESQGVSGPTGTPEAATPEAATEEPDLNSSASTNLTPSDVPTTARTTVLVTEAWSPTTVTPIVTPKVCLCDLTPGFCDIGCCCDIADCDVPDLSTVFTGCSEKPISGVCIEKWLIFRANVDPSLITVTESLFCVRPADNATIPQILPGLSSQRKAVLDYHFSAPRTTSLNLHTRDFYRVDDVILSYFSASSVRGVLRQPSPGPAGSSCIDRNPAKFLRSMSLSCTRMLTPQSCALDPSLRASSYFSGLSLLKVPVPEVVQLTSDLLIPVSPMQSDWPSPREQNGFCLNVVTQVEFIIEYTSRGELTAATVNVVLTDLDSNQVLSQRHSVQFQLATPRTVPEGPIPAVGLKPGSPVIGQFRDSVQPLSVLGMKQGGVCSTEPRDRTPVLFTYNVVTGCTFRSEAMDCGELRFQLYKVLVGLTMDDTLAIPELLAMSSASQPDWTRIITEECPVSPQETCESGCVLSQSLSIQVLWARRGLLALSQSYILGAKYLFQCQKVKCPTSSPLTVTTGVTFVDTTVYPDPPPRGRPQSAWKLPFGFFTGGPADMDAHTASNASGADLSEGTQRTVLTTVFVIWAGLLGLFQR